jgi:prepilin-type N-terminal cleavage/methylation domain-containing protein
MRSPYGRFSTARRATPATGSAYGFSMVELLVTIIIAGIVFGAMIPFFANALSRVSADELRVDATNIAQDRIEQVRLLPYNEITSANLNFAPSPPADPFGDGRFGPSYTQIGESKPYSVSYEVDPLPDANAKHVSVSVSRTGSDTFVTTADTVIDNPQPGDTSLTDAEPTGLSLTVWFDNYSYVITPGVRLQYVLKSTGQTVTVGTGMPAGANHEVTFTGLTGGPNRTYKVSCWSNRASYVLNAPPFRMWTSGRLKFDTYPGGD